MSVLGAVAGSIISGIFSREEGDANRDFQAAMSNTSYQRAMADMRKAGLNPILAGKLGGASTPPGAMAHIPDLGAAFNSAYANQTQRMQTEANVGKVEQEVENLQAELELTEQQTEVARKTVEKVVEEIEYLKKQGRYREAVTAIPGLVSEYLNAYFPKPGQGQGIGARAVESLKQGMDNAGDTYEEMKKGITIIIKKAAGFLDEQNQEYEQWQKTQ